MGCGTSAPCRPGATVVGLSLLPARLAPCGTEEVDRAALKGWG